MLSKEREGAWIINEFDDGNSFIRKMGLNKLLIRKKSSIFRRFSFIPLRYYKGKGCFLFFSVFN